MPKGWWNSGWYPSALINLINAKKSPFFYVLATQNIFSFALLILNIPSFCAMATRKCGIDIFDTSLLMAYSRTQKGGKRPQPFNKTVSHARGHWFKSSTAHHSIWQYRYHLPASDSQYNYLIFSLSGSILR